MKKTTQENTRLHWREEGDPGGAPVVFANSLGTDLTLWDQVIERMPAGLRLIRFDNRGHGQSECPKPPYALSDLIADTEQLLDHLKVQSCLFVGLSIGGLIGQGLASKRPDLIGALVLSNSAAKMGDSAMWSTRIDAVQTGGVDVIADQVMDRWFGERFLKHGDIAKWRDMLTRTPENGYIGCCNALANADLTQSTRKLQLPFLGIAGSGDQACPSAQVSETTETVKGAIFREISGVGHLPCVEDPDAFSNLIVEFIKDIDHGRTI